MPQDGMSCAPPKKKRAKLEASEVPIPNAAIDQAVQVRRDQFNVAEWKLVSRTHNPMQTNTFDCGVFVILFMDLLMLGVPLVFGSADISLIRRKLTLEILNDRNEKTEIIDVN